MIKRILTLIDFALYSFLFLFGTSVLALNMKAHHFQPKDTNTYPDIVFPVITYSGHGTGFVVKFQEQFLVITAAHVCQGSPEVSYLDQVVKPILFDMTHDLCVLPWVFKEPPKRYFTVMGAPSPAFARVEIFSRTDTEQEWTISGFVLAPAHYKDDYMGMDYDSYKMSAVPVPGTSGGPVVLKGTRDVVCIATIVWFFPDAQGQRHFYMGECVSSLDLLVSLGRLQK